MSAVRVQITDFGLSTWTDIVGEEMTPCGTPNYLAPEVIKGNYDDRVDFWSFGVVLYILLCGDFPFIAYHNPADVSRLESQQIKETEGWLSVSEQARNFARGLLTFDPDKRLTHGGCLRHPWLSGEGAPNGWFEDLEVVEAADIAPPPTMQLAGAVANISGWTGSALDSLRFQFRNGSAENCGGQGGFTQIRCTLKPDEVIVAIQQENRLGLAEHLGNAITFYTSSCNALEFQGADARRRLRFVAPIGSQIVGLQFMQSRLTGIHMERVPDSSAGVPLGLVEQIGGRCGYAVDQVSLRLRGGQTRSYGGGGGFEQGPWALEPNEYITVVEQARRDAYLGNSIVFYTSAGRVFKLSGMEASVSRRFAAAPGLQVCGADFDGCSLVSVRLCSAHSSCPEPHEVQRVALS